MDIDQVFVVLKQWMVGLAPGGVQVFVSILLSIGAIMTVFGLCFAVTTLVERKMLGRIQNRYGPNRAGPFGTLQPIADGIKMLTKEDIVPRLADAPVHLLAPFVLTVPVWLAFALLPFGRNMSAIELDAGLLFFFAMVSASELAVFMAGWSSRNKYSLVGAMRAMAQMISYEVPLILAVIPVVMFAGSLSLTQIVQAQSPAWNVFTPWGLAGFAIFLVAATAESNRSPFDLPEAESEIIAGYLTEFSGFKYALFFLGEYLGLFAVSGLAVTLYLGGWQAPLPQLQWLPSWLWFFAKFAVLIAFFIWLRGTVPRLRLDQLLSLAWKLLVPLALINMVVAALWHFTAGWNFIAAFELRWLLGALLVVCPYIFMGRSLTAGLSARRQYYYAI